MEDSIKEELNDSSELLELQTPSESTGLIEDFDIGQIFYLYQFFTQIREEENKGQSVSI